MNKGREVKVGAVKFKSITAAVKAAQKKAEANGQPVPSYMVLYMRIRAGESPSTAVNRKVRKYTKKVDYVKPFAEFGIETAA
jgi:hypothetical protein